MNAGSTDNLSAGHTTGPTSNHAGMMSISLVWWPLVRIERNLRSIRGSLVSRKLPQLMQFQASTPTSIHAAFIASGKFALLDFDLADRQETPLDSMMSFRLLYMTERLCTELSVDMQLNPIIIHVRRQVTHQQGQHDENRNRLPPSQH